MTVVTWLATVLAVLAAWMLWRERATIRRGVVITAP
jgi:ABC-type spermidine/putrescine transport system permease subunit II